MKHLVKIYRIMLRHWGYLVGGLVFMLGFAVLSGVSITMAIPLFDYVFKRPSGAVITNTSIPLLLENLGRMLAAQAGRHGLTGLFGSGHSLALWSEVKNVFLATDPYLLLVAICGALLVVIFIKNIFYYCHRVLFASLRGKTVIDARAMIYRKYLSQSLAFFNKTSVGDALIRITSDIKTMNDLCVDSTFDIFRNTLLLAVYICTALLINPRLFLVSILLFPLYSLVVGLLGRKIKKYARRLRHQSVRLFSTITERLYNMPIVKAFSREEHEYRTFQAINLKYYEFWRKSVIYSAINQPLSEINGTVVGVIVLLIGGHQVLSGASTLGKFTAFLFAVFSILNPIKQLTKAYMDFKKAMVSIERIGEILELREEIVEPAVPVRKEGFTSGLELRNIGFAYQGGPPVLKGVSLTITKGERVAIVGRSGAGKTTLVNLLPRLYDVSAGQILIDSVPVKDLAIKDLRTLFGLVTQESILFSDTIANNIRYGSLKPVTDAQVREAARIAYADEFIRQLPRQYDEMLNPKASNLSGGQKQRLCIARAIVGDPPILIFDEATSALDSEAEQKVQQAIERATANRTVIVIAHRLATVLSADKIVVLKEGKIVGLGSHPELLKSCDQYRTLYELQFKDQG